jgi:hypothetical protein
MIKSFARPVAWLLLAAVIFVTVSPIQFRPVTGEPPDLERFTAFAVVGLAFAIGYPRRWLLVACLIVASAFAIESAQLLVPGRHARLEDASVKAFGGLAGLIIGAALVRLKSRFR